MNITLNITDATAELLRADAHLRAGLGPGLSAVAVQSVQDHLQARYLPLRNKLGGTPTGYWRDVHDSAAAVTVVNGEASYTTTVTLSGVGLRMKLEGGIIRPTGRISSVTGKPIKYLTIPVIPAAYGKTAGEFPGLKPRGGVLAMVPEGRGFGIAHFMLVKQVKITADPNIWPPASAILGDMGEALTFPAAA